MPATAPPLTIANFIDGSFRPACNGSELESINPATGNVHATLPASDHADVEHAVAAASRAFPAWAAMPATDRAAILMKLADRIDAHRAELATLESTDTGKPLRLSSTVDIPRAAANFRFFASAIMVTRSESHDMHSAGFNYTLRRPRGVAGCISPWNLPLYLLSWKIAPALATGNTVVAKPSEMTPATAFRMCELAHDAGLPPGVLNIIHGTGTSAGGALVTHHDVPTVSFTGGTLTGAAIAKTAGPMFKRLSLEMGGKNATIVFEDAAFDRAVETSVRAAFTNQGQICLCGSRILVQRSLADRFTDAFLAKAAELRIGCPMDEGTDIGAVISHAHQQKILQAIEQAVADGGCVRLGGSVPDPATLPAHCRNGFFVQPTVITDVNAACAANQEEIFGPVVTILPFEDEAHAIELANGTRYGLAASVWTRNISCAHRVAAAVDAGVVWINCWLVRDLRTPFGGMKQSGLGREGGDEALRFFTEPKNICVGL
ncbi:MAG: aldehyde dehydrogenase [Phycisphaerales bacterium]